MRKLKGKMGIEYVERKEDNCTLPEPPVPRSITNWKTS